MRIAVMLTATLVAALVALAIPNSRGGWRRVLLPLAAVIHAALTASLWARPGALALGAIHVWLKPDAAGLLFLALTSGLFLPTSFYALGDMKRNAARGQAAGPSERVYVAGLLFFLFSISVVCLAQDMGLLWVAVEATTLTTAPIIYFRKNQASLEATWKYLLICSVGIALALLGTFLLAVGAGEAPGGWVTLRIRLLAALGPLMDPMWLKAAFIFLLVGYGAKMGLAPMHTWLPDAYSEAPSPVWPILSGMLLNGAFLAIVRAVDIMQSAGLGEFTNGLLRLFGLLSMGIAGAFIIEQKNFNRLLAYSSIEHMGILAFGAGLGGAGIWAALFHAVNHTFAKGCLFLTAGNIMYHYQSKSTLTVTGVRRTLPISGGLWLAGFLAICGLPPFGTFFSEFAMLKTAFADGRYGEGALYLAFLAVVFIGMLTVVLGMLRGEAPPEEEGEKRESVWMTLPALLAALVVLALGMGIPGFLGKMINAAAFIVDHNFSAMPGVIP